MGSPWVDRFSGVLDDDYISSKTRIAPEPRRGLNKEPIDVAVDDLRRALKSIYIPTANNVELIKKLLSKAISYSKDIYPTNKAFLKEVYSPGETAVFPSCLTGHAGVGKTQLIRALGRVMPAAEVIHPGEGHENFRMESMWSVKTRKLIPMLRSLLPNDTGRAKVDDLVSACRKLARRDGISLVVIDELQAFSASSAASSSVTSAILEFSNIGVPLIYSCNYSLCHKFLRRNDHDKHRLLGDPLILLPDVRGSQDWREFIDECCRVADGVISLPDEAAITRIYNYSAGLKRLALELMCLAYRTARENGHSKATIVHVEAAYLSLAFMMFRKDVEILHRQEIEGTKIRDDLWCPFDLPKTKQQEITEQWRVKRKEMILSAALHSSLSPEESKNLKAIRQEIKKEMTPTALAVEKKNKPEKVSTDLLIANARRLRERIDDDK